MTFIAISGIIMILILLGLLFLVPAQSKREKKRKKQQEAATPLEEELRAKIARLEKHIQSLREEIQSFQNAGKDQEKDLAVEKAKVKKLQEKLSQEREWHQKEQSAIDKKGSEFLQIKQELLKLQELFSGEHAANLRFEHEVKELKRNNDALNEQRRGMESENARLKARMESQRLENARLKQENTELQKKKEDVNWIAKSEYDRVAKLLKEKEKELERISGKPRELE